MTDGDRFRSPIFLNTPNFRRAIDHQQRFNNDAFGDVGLTMIVSVEIGDNEAGENQARVIKALKSAIEACGGKASPF